MSVEAKTSRALSVKDLNEIEMVDKQIKQVKNIRKSVENLNRQGAAVEDIKNATDSLLNQLSEGRAEIKEKRNIIEKLDRTVKELETVPKSDYKKLTSLDIALVELEQQKAVLRKHLSSLEKLNLYIDVLGYKIYEVQHDYTTDMDMLRDEKEQLLAREDIIDEDLKLLLAEIDKKIKERQALHVAATANLETQKSTLEQESHLKMQDLDTKMEEIRQKHSKAIQQLEEEKLNATPSQLDVIGRKIDEINAKCEDQLDELKTLQTLGWTVMSSEEKLAAALEQKDLRVTKSGRLLTKKGKLITLEQAENMGILNDLDMPWEKIKAGIRALELKRDDVDQVSEPTDDLSEGSMYSRMTSEDVHYLKDTLGRPLTLAMAEILLKQPRDPIHYLGHWLFKYRYNQELDEASKQEISELTAERARLAKERWKAEVLEEAQRAVLNLIVRVEEEIMRRELERALRAAEEQEEEEEHNEILEMQ